MATSEDFLNAPTDYGPLTQRQAENVADLAARRTQERIYAEIGRNVVTKVIYASGAALIAVATWLSGWFHFGPK